ncbi:MAG: hypothetical protein M1608_03520 [Candidatus Omnitrophica bacterium]|nr:hypothetical protein [Candidatus Omnitrophota bacterium]
MSSPKGNPRLHRRPLTIRESIEREQSWLDQPCARLIYPADQHWAIFQKLLCTGSATGNLVSDGHPAALAVEYHCVLRSTDLDFARFRGLKWNNPIVV